MLDIHTEIIELRKAGRPAVCVTVVDREGHIPTRLQAKMLVDANGRVAGTVGGGAIEKLAIEEARRVLEVREPGLKTFLLDDREPAPGELPTGMPCGGRATLFFELLVAGDRAYLFGAGHVNRALQTILSPLEFDVTFVDYRPEQLADLPAPHLAAGDDYADLPALPDLADSFVLIATHSHACDERVLEAILRAGVRPRYLGVVASRRKRASIYPRLRESLGADIDLDSIFMPVGLHLGGNSPSAVALSIAAEMQACRSGIAGHAHMRDRGAS